MKTRTELEAMYSEVGRFFEGLARARKGDKWFHIRFDGTPAYTQRYTWVGSFSEGLALVRRDGRQFHIRLDGTEVE